MALAAAVALFIFGGALCGIIAILKIKTLRHEMDELRRRLEHLNRVALKKDVRPVRRKHRPAAASAAPEESAFSGRAAQAKPPAAAKESVLTPNAPESGSAVPEGKKPPADAPDSKEFNPATAFHAERAPSGVVKPEKRIVTDSTSSGLDKAAAITGMDLSDLFRLGLEKIRGGRDEDGAPLSFEFQFGAQWIIWIGALIFLGGVALGLKYAYDNELIGPAGRLAVGIFTGIVIGVLGEYWRRREWRIPFQVFTGGAMAIFYLCIYFSFQVYSLTGQGISMGLAVGVTGLAIFLSVLHSALPMALLAVTGGFLSPVMLSTGENSPHALFIYLAILNLVALGAAFFRHWRILNQYCFTATSFLYMAWYLKFGKDAGQMPPALIYTSVFYLIFMIAPALHSIVRCKHEQVEDMVLLAVNSLFSLVCYALVLAEDYRQVLGFFVLGQAVVVFVLFQLWLRRVKKPTNGALSLLVICLSLLCLAVPLHLRFSFWAMAWAMEAVVYTYLGIRYGSRLCRLAGTGAILLACGSLVKTLPLHHEIFSPILNAPFGSWISVAISAAAAALLIWHMLPEKDKWRVAQSAFFGSLATVLMCLALTMETSLYWRIPKPDCWEWYESTGLLLLWTALSLIAVLSIRRWRLEGFLFNGITILIITSGLYVWSLTLYGTAGNWYLLNPSFATRFCFPVLLLTGAWWLPRELLKAREIKMVMGLAGLIGLCALLTLETSYFWRLPKAENWFRNETASLAVLWAVIPVALAYIAKWRHWKDLIHVMLAAEIAGIVIFIIGLSGYVRSDDWLFLNLPFYTRLIFAVNCWISAWLVFRLEGGEGIARPLLVAAGTVLTAFLLSLDTALFWREGHMEGWFWNQTASLTVLWAIIPAMICLAAWRLPFAEFPYMMLAAQGAGVVFFLWGLAGYNLDNTVLVFNLAFLPRLMYIVNLQVTARFFAASVTNRPGSLSGMISASRKPILLSMEMTGHLLLVVVCWMELVRWGRFSETVSRDMAVGVISAVWALHACVLIWHGLRTHEPVRRYAGFALFAIATCKTVILDTFNLEAVYRIASWLGIGMLLVIAALFYQRYSANMLRDTGHEEK
jgi:uncharacterized membrane protein